MKRTLVFLLSALALVSCVKDGEENKQEDPKKPVYVMISGPAQNITEDSARLCCRFSVPDRSRLFKDYIPYILVSNTDLESLFKYGVVDGAGLDESWAGVPSSILELKPGEDFRLEDKFLAIVPKDIVRDTLKTTITGLKPDTQYYYGSALVVVGEKPEGVYGGKQTFRTAVPEKPEDGDAVKKEDLLGRWESPYSKSMEPFGFSNLTYDGGTSLYLFENGGFSMKDHGSVTCSSADEASKLSDALLFKGYTSTTDGRVVAFKWGGVSLEGTFEFASDTRTLTFSPYYPPDSKYVYVVRLEEDGSLVLTDENGQEKSYKR